MSFINSIKPIKLTDKFIKNLIYSISYISFIKQSNTQIKLKLISSGTSSGAQIYLYNQDNNNYVIKFICIYSHRIKLEIINEYKIYNYLNMLRYLNVCDNIILNYDSAIYTNTNYDNVKYKKCFVMVNETYTANETCITLYTFLNNLKQINNTKLEIYLKQIIPTLLFQLTYTLECLVRVKAIHNDLHLNNILVFINNNNIIDKPENFTIDNLKYNKYILKPRAPFNYFGPDNVKHIKNKYNIQTNNNEHTYLVPDYGFKIKIFDFDNSSIYNINNKPVFSNNNSINEYNDMLNVFINIIKFIINIINNKKLHKSTLDVNSTSNPPIFEKYYYHYYVYVIRYILNDYIYLINSINNIVPYSTQSEFIKTVIYTKNYNDVIDENIKIFNNINDLMPSNSINYNNYVHAYKYIPSVYSILTTIFYNTNSKNDYINFKYNETKSSYKIINTFNIDYINNKLWKLNKNNNIMHRLYDIINNMFTLNKTKRNTASYIIKSKIFNNKSDDFIKYIIPLNVIDNKPINAIPNINIKPNSINLNYNNDVSLLKKYILFVNI